MEVVGHQVTLLDFTLLLPSQASKHFPEVLSDHSVEHLPAILRDEDDVMFTIPFRVP